MLYLVLLFLVFRGEGSLVGAACSGSNTHNVTTSNTTDVTTTTPPQVTSSGSNTNNDTTSQGVPLVSSSGENFTLCAAELEGRIPYRFNIIALVPESVMPANTTATVNSSTDCSLLCRDTKCVFGYFDELTGSCVMYDLVQNTYFKKNSSMVSVFKLYMPGNVVCNKTLIDSVISEKTGLNELSHNGMYYIYNNPYNEDIVYAFYPNK